MAGERIFYRVVFLDRVCATLQSSLKKKLVLGSLSVMDFAVGSNDLFPGKFSIFGHHKQDIPSQWKQKAN